METKDNFANEAQRLLMQDKDNAKQHLKTMIEGQFLPHQSAPLPRQTREFMYKLDCT